jgi:hypothetical protein
MLKSKHHRTICEVTRALLGDEQLRCPSPKSKMWHIWMSVLESLFDCLLISATPFVDRVAALGLTARLACDRQSYGLLETKFQ